MVSPNPKKKYIYIYIFFFQVCRRGVCTDEVISGELNQGISLCYLHMSFIHAPTSMGSKVLGTLKEIEKVLVCSLVIWVVLGKAE